MKNEYQKPKTSIKSKFNIPLITMFMAGSGGLSSKRIAGLFGWLICLVLLCLGFYFEKPIDEFADYVLITSASLLGVDSLSGIFSKSNRG